MAFCCNRQVLAAGNVVLLDVREPKEIEDLGTIEGAINIPLNELEKRLNSAAMKSFEDLLLCAFCRVFGDVCSDLKLRGPRGCWVRPLPRALHAGPTVEVDIWLEHGRRGYRNCWDQP